MSKLDFSDEILRNSQYIKLPSLSTEGMEDESTLQFDKEEYEDYLGGKEFDPYAEIAKYGSLDEARAQQQSGGEQLLHGLGKMGTTAGTTFLAGTIGLGYGIGAAIGEGKFSNLWNNAVTNSLDEFNQKMEQVLPNYYTEDERNSFAAGFGANFWGDMFLKNTGYAIGAAAEGILTGNFASVGAIGSNIARRSLMRTVGKEVAEKIAKGSVDDVAKASLLYNELASGSAKLSPEILEGITKNAQRIKTLNGLAQVEGSILASAGEASMEALQMKKQFITNKIQEINNNYDSKIAIANEIGDTFSAQILSQEKQNELSKVEELSNNAGNLTFGLNMALLSANNYAQFKNVFSGLSINKPIASSIGKGSLREGLEYLAPTKLEKYYHILKNPVIEGSEEFNQLAVSNTAENYYGQEINPDAKKDKDSFIESVIKGYSESFSKEGAENALLGIMTGAIGIPSIRRGKPIIAGGVYNELQNFKKEEDDIQSAVNILNNYRQSPEFQTLETAATRDIVLDKVKSGALQNDDTYTYKTAEASQLVNVVNAATKLGRFQELLDTYEGFNHYTPDEIRGANIRDVDSDGNKLPEPVSAMQDWTDDEVKSFVRNKTNKLIEDAKTIRQLKEDLDYQLAGVDEKTKEVLVNQGFQIKDHSKRYDDLVNEITKAGVSGVSYDNILKRQYQLTGYKDYVDFSTRKKYETSRAIKDLNYKIERLKNLEEDKTIISKSIENNPELINSEIENTNLEIQNINEEKKNEFLGLQGSKLTKYQNKLEAKQKDLQEYLEALKETKKQIDSHNKEEKELQTKHANKLKKDNRTWSEIKAETDILLDDADRFQTSLKERKIDNPVDIKKVDDAMKDMQKLFVAKNQFLNNYTKAFLSIQKDGYRNELTQKLEKINKDIQAKEVLEQSKRYKHGDIIRDSQGNIFEFNRTKNNTAILHPVTQDENGNYIPDENAEPIEVPIDKDFINNFHTERDYNDYKQEYQQSIVDKKQLQNIIENKKSESLTVDRFVQNVVNGTNDSSVETLQFYENNKNEIENKLAEIQVQNTSFQEDIDTDPTNLKWEEDSKKTIEDVFSSTTTNISEDKINSSIPIESYETRFNKTVNNLPINGETKGIIVQPDKLFTEEEFKKLKSTWGKSYDEEDSDTTSLFMILTNNESKILEVNPDGNITGNFIELSDLVKNRDKVAFAPVATATEVKIQEAGKTSKDVAEASLNKAKEQRNILANIVAENGFAEVDLDKKSGGFPIFPKDLSTAASTPISSITEDYQIQVSQNGTVTFNGKTISAPKGSTIIYDNGTGNTLRVLPSTLGNIKGIVPGIIGMFKQYASNHKLSENGVDAKGALEIQVNDRVRNLFTELKELIHFGSYDNLKKEFFPVAQELAKRIQEAEFEVKIAESVNPISQRASEARIELIGLQNQYNDLITNPDNLQIKNVNKLFNIVTNSDIPGGYIQIRDKQYPLLSQEDLTKGEVKLDRNTEVVLSEFLTDRFLNVNKSKLNKPDQEFSYVTSNDEGELIIETYPTYEDFLKQKANFSTKALVDSNRKMLQKDSITGKISETSVPIFLNQYVTYHHNYNLEDYEKTEPEVNLNLNPDLIARAKEKLAGKQLGEETKEEIKPSTSGNPFQTSEDVDFNELEQFRTGQLTESKITEDLHKMRNWVNSTFGGKVDFKVLNRILNNGAIGKFRDSAIEIYEGAEVGTTYHEAFHAVTSMFLTNSERNRLYNEAKNDSKIKAIIDKIKSKTSLYNENQLVEEALAEEFRDYMLNPEGYNFSENNVRKTFFQRLLDFIKNLFIKDKNLTKDLFQKIESGYFATKKINTYISEDKYRLTFEDFTDDIDHSAFKSTAYANAIMDSLTALFSNYFFKENKLDNLMSVFEGNSSNSTEVFKAYSKAFDVLETSKNSNESNRAFVKKHREHILDKHKEYLKIKYGIEFRLENPELQEELQKEVLGDAEFANDSLTNSWQFESIKLSSKDNSSSIIKFFLGTLPNVDLQGNPVRNILNLPKTVDFSKTFNFLTNKLAGNRDLQRMAGIIESYSKLPEFAYLSVLQKRLKLDSLLKGEFSNLNKSELLLQMKFFDAFSKYNYSYFGSVLGANGEYSLFDSNADNMQNSIKNDWKQNSNISDLISKSGEVDKFYDPAKFSNLSVKGLNVNNIQDFYKAVGITFYNYNVISDYDKNILLEQAKFLLDKIKAGNQKYLFSEYTDSDFKGKLTSIAQIETKYRPDIYENSFINGEGDRVFTATLFTPFAKDISDINGSNTLEELYYSKPELNPMNNPYSGNSVILGKLFNAENKRTNLSIAFRIHDNNKESEGESKSFSKLKENERILINIGNHNKGFYPVIRPADNELERFISLTNNESGKTYQLVSENDLVANKHLDIMHNYLLSEITRFYTPTKDTWKNYSDNLDKGIVTSILRDSTDKIQGYIEEIYKQESLEKALDYITPAIEKEFKKTIDTYFKNKTTEYVDILKGYELLTEDSLGLHNKGIPLVNSKGDKITSGNGIVTAIYDYLVNDTISNIEQTKLFFGDSVMYKSPDDYFKRIKASHGAIKTTSESFNDAIEYFYPRTDSKEFKDWKLKNGKSIVRMAVFEDPTVKSDYFEEYKKIIENDENADNYDNMVESDGFAFISMDEAREFHLRQSDWTIGKGSAEEVYQWEMQKYLHWVIQNETSTEDKPKAIKEFERIFKVEFKEQDFKPINPDTGEVIERGNTVLNSIKPSHYGSYAEDLGLKGMVKCSLGMVMPSSFMNYNKPGKLAIKRPALKALADAMRKNAIGIVSSYSANKGVTTKIPKQNANTTKKLSTPAYINVDGNYVFNIDTIIQTTQDTYYNNWGTQVATGFKSHDEVVFGTQAAKQILVNLYNRGEAINPELDNLKNEYLQLNEIRVKKGVEKLVKRLGLKEIDDNYQIDDISNFVNTLKQEAISRNMSDNTIDQISHLGSQISIDGLVNRQKVNNILFSIANKLTIKQKFSGKPAYQIPSSLYEPLGIRKVISEDGKERLGSNFLKFYRTEEGKLKSMQVLLPNFLKENLPIGKVDPKLLKIIGFRIPTQGMNSIESIEVVGFLPKEMGDTIVLPTEIVAKAGSDYDIDKMNLYIKNYKINKNGIAEPIAYDKTKSDNSQEAIENRMIEIFEEILLHPSNSKQLLNPISSNIIKSARSYVNRLRGKDKLNIPTYKVVERGYLNQVHTRNMEGKGGVGIAALASTFHILAQMYDIKLNKTISVQEYGDFGSSSIINIPSIINLPHTSDEEGNIVLGAFENKDKEDIAEVVAQLVSACVDNAKDPILGDLNWGLQTLNTVSYLAMAGVPSKYIALFMNQPIILDYIKQQNIHESQLSEILSKTNYNDTKETKEYKRGLKKYKNEIIADLKAKYGIASIGNRELTKAELEESIKGNINNTLQVKVLDDFIRYQQAAKELKDVIQGSTYDTSGLGGDMNELSYKLALTNRVMNVGNFINFDKLMNSGFISPYFEAAKSAEQIFAPLYTVHNNPVLKASYLEILNQFFNREYPIGRDRVTGVLKKYTDYLLSYIITSNKGYKINNTIENKALTSEIERLFTGENSIPRRTLELQKVLPNNALIQAMKVTLDVTGEYGIDGMGLASSKRDTLTSNTYTENFRELFQSNQAQYAEDLMKFILLQSGLNYSPISMVDLIPYEKYSEVFGYAMNKKVSPDEINQFTNLTFKREAYEDDDIVPKKKVRNKAAQVFSKKYDKLAKFLNKGIDVNSLIARGVQVFKLKPTLTDTNGNKVTPNSVKRYREKVSLLDLSDKTNTVVQNSSEENISKYSKENLDSKKQVAQELKMKCKTK